jgi:hypothetical protein
MKYSENQAAFTLKDEKGFSVLIITKPRSNYPNYRQVIPGDQRARHIATGGISTRVAPGGDNDQ